MISLKVDWLEAGGLPVYDMDGVGDAYFLDDHRQWIQLNLHQRPRLIIPLGGIDCLLTEFEAQLPFLVAELLTLGGDDGTIIFSIRTFGQLNWYGDEEMHWFVIAGLAYIPHLATGTPLGDENPAQAILRALRDDPTSQAAQDARAAQNLRELIHAVELKEARDRSRALLEEFLTAEQREELMQSACFHVQGGDGFRYQIRLGQAHNVFRVDEAGQRVIEYCLITRGAMPVCDQLLAQKVLLETDPETFHKTANAWALEGTERRRLNPPPPVPRERWPDLIGEELEIALWRPDTVPRRLDGRGEAEGNARVALGVGVHVAGEGGVAGEPAIGAPAAELVGDLGGAGDGLGIAAVGAEVDAPCLDMGTPEAAPLAEQVVPPRLLE